MATGKLWTEKYRPKKMSDYIVADELIGKKVKQWVGEGIIPHLLFGGPPGVGKTTLAMVLLEELGIDSADLLIINASLESNVDTIREKVFQFASTMPMNSNYKIVFLDECDQLSPAAQGVMRKLMEDYSDHTRYILACNAKHKMIPALVSRCQEFTFKKPDTMFIFERMINILELEKVEFDVEILDQIVSVHYPDMRKIIQCLQQYTVDGKLQPPTEGDDSTSDWKIKLMEHLQSGDWKEARKLVCSSIYGDEWEDLYRFLYENLGRASKFAKQERRDEAVIEIADHLYRHSMCADPEINAAALLIKLSNISEY